MRACRKEILIFLLGIDLIVTHRLFALQSINNEGQHLIFMFRSHDNVNPFNTADELMFELRIAFRDHNECSTIHPYDFLDGLPALPVSHLGDRAGVDDTNVRRLPLLCHDRSMFPELGCNG